MKPPECMRAYVPREGCLDLPLSLTAQYFATYHGPNAALAPPQLTDPAKQVLSRRQHGGSCPRSNFYFAVWLVSTASSWLERFVLSRQFRLLPKPPGVSWIRLQTPTEHEVRSFHCLMVLSKPSLLLTHFDSLVRHPRRAWQLITPGPQRCHTLQRR